MAKIRSGRGIFVDLAWQGINCQAIKRQLSFLLKCKMTVLFKLLGA